MLTKYKYTEKLWALCRPIKFFSNLFPHPPPILAVAGPLKKKHLILRSYSTCMDALPPLPSIPPFSVICLFLDFIGGGGGSGVGSICYWAKGKKKKLENPIFAKKGGFSSNINTIHTYIYVLCSLYNT